MSQLPRLTWLFATALILAPACASENTSSKGQLIECTQSASGPTNCAPTDSATPSAPGMCTDVDEDGDGDDHDEMDDDDDHEGGTSEMDDDDDDDGMSDADDADDDNDGIGDADDCDEDAGGDDHD